MQGYLGMSHCIQSWAHSSQMAYSMAGSDRYAEPNEWQHGKTTAFKLGISKKPRVKDHVRPQRGVQGQWNGPLRTSPGGGRHQPEHIMQRRPTNSLAMGSRRGVLQERALMSWRCCKKIAFGHLTGSFKRGQQKQPFHAGPHKLPETKKEVRHGETPFS